MNEETYEEVYEEIFNKILNIGSFESDKNISQSNGAIRLKSQGFLITPHVNSYIYEPSKTGEEVLLAGGWKAYNQQKKKMEKILEKKEYYDSKISKLKYYTFWPALLLGIIGGLHSLVEIVKPYTTDKKSKIESIIGQSELSTPVEVQKKSSNLPVRTVDTVSSPPKTK